MEVNESNNQLAIYSTIDYSKKEEFCSIMKENDKLLYDLKYILDLKRKNNLSSLNLQQNENKVDSAEKKVDSYDSLP